MSAKPLIAVRVTPAIKQQMEDLAHARRTTVSGILSALIERELLTTGLPPVTRLGDALRRPAIAVEDIEL